MSKKLNVAIKKLHKQYAAKASACELEVLDLFQRRQQMRKTPQNNELHELNAEINNMNDRRQIYFQITKDLEDLIN